MPEELDGDVELHLLLPASWYAALEVLAERQGLTVPELVRRAVDHFTETPALLTKDHS